ncbi:acylneuraminate cytidylyltransferase family protein [Acidobacteria bacterium AH-259-L09]|nr:acylneuraminate cytidylyltransferase family protein [Acidobacteria bacterium AH-259-L09]
MNEKGLNISRSNVLAIIPARGGSKNPPRKNILAFKGKPLIVHSIEQALEAELVGRVIVSTDSEKIAEISLQAGAEVPFMRPGQLARDHSTDLEVFRHALSWLAEHEHYTPEILVHLRPTAPLRPPGLIDMGVRRLLSHPKADSLRTVILTRHTPYKMWRLNGDYLEPLLTHSPYSEPYNMPRQLLPKVYWQNAYLDITRRSTVMEKDSMTGERILAFVMAPDHDVDIDSQGDLVQARRKSESAQNNRRNDGQRAGEETPPSGDFRA